MNNSFLGKPAAVIVLAGAVIVVGVGAWFLFGPNEEGEKLPRYSVDFQVPEGAVFEVDEQFSVVSSITTVTPALDEYLGKWDPAEPYQRSWQLEGFYFLEGPLAAVSGKDVVVKREEVEEPPAETERGISTATAVFTCTGAGRGTITFAYTVNQANYGVQTMDMEVMEVECVESAGLPPDEFGGSPDGGAGAEGGAGLEADAPASSPGIEVCGLPGGPACPPRY